MGVGCVQGREGREGLLRPGQLGPCHVLAEGEGDLAQGLFPVGARASYTGQVSVARARKGRTAVGPARCAVRSSTVRWDRGRAVMLVTCCKFPSSRPERSGVEGSLLDR